MYVARQEWLKIADKNEISEFKSNLKKKAFTHMPKLTEIGISNVYLCPSVTSLSIQAHVL